MQEEKTQNAWYPYYFIHTTTTTTSLVNRSEFDSWISVLKGRKTFNMIKHQRNTTHISSKTKALTCYAMFDARRYLPLSRPQPPWSAGIAERFHELWPVLQFPLPRLQHLLPRLLFLLLCYCSIFARIQTLLPLVLLLLLPSKFPSSSPRLTFFCPTTFGLSLGLENQDETKATKLCHFQRNRLEELAAPSSALFVKLYPELPWFKIIRNHSTPETNFASMQITKSKNNTQTNKTKNEITDDPDPNLSLDFFQPQRKNRSNREKQETDLLSSLVVVVEVLLLSFSSVLSSSTFWSLAKQLATKFTNHQYFTTRANKKVVWFAVFGRLWKMLSTDY